ncbi:uncharacterized protein V1518DRAFT_420007 [Limtongia smithiae]|uniref:uncharacterized protein n=1 Tax=Limtongia smithiae TaxID=1125753 RepID=UPI0034CD8697
MNSSIFNTIPSEILGDICGLLPATDALLFALTCQRARVIVDDVWRLRAYRDFGQDGVSAAEALIRNNHRTLTWPFIYDTILQHKYYFADGKCNVTWGHDLRYWKIMDCCESAYGKTLSLLQVCWLSVSRTISLYPASYHLTIGISTNDILRSPGLNNLRFNVKLCDYVNGELHTVPISSRILPPNTLYDIQRRGWFEIHITDVTVPLSGDGARSHLKHIVFEIKDTENNNWKHGLNLDYIKIQMVSPDQALEAEPVPEPMLYAELAAPTSQ